MEGKHKEDQQVPLFEQQQEPQPSLSSRQNQAPASTGGSLTFCGILSLVAFSVIFIIVTALFIIYFPEIVKLLQYMFSWVKDKGYWGVFAYFLIVIVACILLVPVTFLGVGSALTFQSMYGETNAFFVTLLVVYGGYYIGSVIAFLLVFQVGDLNVRKCMVNRFRLLEALDLALYHEGIKLTVLLRLGLCSPYNLLNYALSVTRLSLRDYLIGSTVMVVHVIFDIIAAFTLSEISKLLKGNFKDSKFLILIIFIELFCSILLMIVMVKSVNKEMAEVQRRHANLINSQQ